MPFTPEKCGWIPAKPIQAHGFSVFYNEKEKLWYWYGENKEKTVGGKQNTIWHWGVRLYTSPDLYSWTDKGLIIPPTPEDLTSPLHPTYQMDRPHILYNKTTKSMWPGSRSWQTRSASS